MSARDGAEGSSDGGWGGEGREGVAISFPRGQGWGRSCGPNAECGPGLLSAPRGSDGGGREGDGE